MPQMGLSQAKVYQLPEGEFCEFGGAFWGGLMNFLYIKENLGLKA